MTHVNVCEFRTKSKNIYGSYRADGQTDGRKDQPKSLTFFNFRWKVIKRALILNK